MWERNGEDRKSNAQEQQTWPSAVTYVCGYIRVRKGCSETPRFERLILIVKTPSFTFY